MSLYPFGSAVLEKENLIKTGGPVITICVLHNWLPKSRVNEGQGSKMESYGHMIAPPLV